MGFVCASIPKSPQRQKWARYLLFDSLSAFLSNTSLSASQKKSLLKGGSKHKYNCFHRFFLFFIFFITDLTPTFLPNLLSFRESLRERERERERERCVFGAKYKHLSIDKMTIVNDPFLIIKILIQLQTEKLRNDNRR
jgi:hypothetical protein